MKKASKLLTIILVVALLCGVLSGCAMFGRNTSKYRGMTAIKVGNEEITVGKILDTFNSNYSNYQSYVSAGYITADYLLEMTMSSLTNQALKVDSYVSDANNPVFSHEYSNVYHNAQYLKKDEVEYCIDYAKYATFSTFDDSVITLLSVDREIGAEATEDTSRNFTEPDDLAGFDTYAEYSYNNSVFNKDVAEYFDKYYSKVTRTHTLDVSDYVFASEDAAKDMLKAINDRIEDNDQHAKDVSFTDLKNAQEKVVKQYQRNVKNTYNMELADFLKNQVNDMVASVIVSKYNLKVNKKIETDDINATIEQLEKNLSVMKAAQEARFDLKKDFDSFITGLTSTSYIYDVPAEYEGKYIFVKNILIPFTDNQKTTLSNLLKDVGGNSDNEAYLNLRNKFASEVIADDFNNKLDDGTYDKASKLFKLDDNKNLIINPDGALGKYFNADLSINPMEEKTLDETVIELMKQYNTDTAQHSAQYDYVVRVGDTPSDYQHSWVQEFVDAANVAHDKGVGHYALAISTYGVHIVYYSADVVAQDFSDFKTNYLATDKPQYRMFKTYYSEQSSLRLSADLENLKTSYLDGDKIVVNSIFNTFLKDNGFTYDLIKSLRGEEE